VELEQDIKNLKKWMSQNPKAIVRLDANELWTGQDLETLLSRLTATELASIEYLEDPCPIRDWQKISFSNKPPLALEQTSPNTPSDIWVYRPSSTKGFLLGMCELEQHLQESAHVDVVLSSSFETELGLQWCIFMANALELKRAQGLGTLSHLGPERAPADHLQVDDKGARVCILRA
jgi:O-succinylbenzoate synthase